MQTFERDESMRQRPGPARHVASGCNKIGKLDSCQDRFKAMPLHVSKGLELPLMAMVLGPLATQRLILGVGGEKFLD